MIEHTSGPPGPPSAAVDRAALRTCTPAPGPRRRAVEPVVVDAELVWILRTPGLRLGVARPSSPGMLGELCLDLDIEAAAARGAVLDALFSDDDVVDAAARVVSERLEALPGLPALPFIGEPFGGEEGTD